MISISTYSISTSYAMCFKQSCDIKSFAMCLYPKKGKTAPWLFNTCITVYKYYVAFEGKKTILYTYM
jgi:hypothetical protein